MLKRVLRRVANSLGYEIHRIPTVQRDENVARVGWLARLRSEESELDLGQRFTSSCARFFGSSRAQLFQDVFVLTVLGFKSDGFFVEFGATDGVDLSNSYLLETQFGWTGILAEPARSWHDALATNRAAQISKRCVWKVTGETLPFREAAAGELSTLLDFANFDRHAGQREDGRTYSVETISLSDLLLHHHAPASIDYLSIDTEGSEAEILKAHDFSRFRFKVISVEHNYTVNREIIHRLLVSQGYTRVLEQFSQWDDWYVDHSLLRQA